MILKNLNFIQSCNFNLIDFLKLRNFYYDLVLLNRRPQNHKNKNVEEKSLAPAGKCFPQNSAFSSLLRAKIVIPPLKAAVFEKLWGHYELKREVRLRSTKI